jgi:hypothetical protein
MEKHLPISFGTANCLLNGEGVAVPAAAPSKQFLMNLILRKIHCQNKTRIGTL